MTAAQNKLLSKRRLIVADLLVCLSISDPEQSHISLRDVKHTNLLCGLNHFVAGEQPEQLQKDWDWDESGKSNLIQWISLNSADWFCDIMWSSVSMEGPTCRHGFSVVILPVLLVSLPLSQRGDLPSPLTFGQQLHHNHVAVHGSVPVLATIHQHTPPQLCRETKKPGQREPMNAVRTVNVTTGNVMLLQILYLCSYWSNRHSWWRLHSVLGAYSHSEYPEKTERKMQDLSFDLIIHNLHYWACSQRRSSSLPGQRLHSRAASLLLYILATCENSSLCLLPYLQHVRM